ncbi:MAG: SixA phosphatase family protein [Cyclobacteriaceae bacterium]
MKKLYLIRHAKSSWDNPEIDDFDRSLNERGKKDAPRMGKRLKERDLTPDLMISSPASRALDTCKAIAKVLGYPKEKIIANKRLYHANEDQLLKVIQELKDRHKDEEEIVLLFGHNPGLTDFANELFSESIDNIPTCGIVAGKLKIKLWKEAAFGCGEMEFFDFPRNKTD